MSDLAKAIILATTYHDGQLDKCGMPYILHPLYVMGQMENETDMIIAVLHDVIEDTRLTFPDLISYRFGGHIEETFDYDEWYKKLK